MVGDPGAARTATARFREWPLGSRGAYATEIEFDRPGAWRLDLSVGAGSASIEIEVAEESAIVDIGGLPPFAANKTLANVESVEQLTSDPTPDPELYTTTIPQALIAGRPAVVVFATPALCTSPTCGPQVDTVSRLRERRPEQASFIHVEVYDNPADIQGDLANAVYSPLVDAWGFTTAPNWFNESWTYVLGADGRVTARFEGFRHVGRTGRGAGGGALARHAAREEQQRQRQQQHRADGRSDYHARARPALRRGCWGRRGGWHRRGSWRGRRSRSGRGGGSR